VAAALLDGQVGPEQLETDVFAGPTFKTCLSRVSVARQPI